jgi:hypothetical protein
MNLPQKDTIIVFDVRINGFLHLPGRKKTNKRILQWLKGKSVMINVFGTCNEKWWDRLVFSLIETLFFKSETRQSDRD